MHKTWENEHNKLSQVLPLFTFNVFVAMVANGLEQRRLSRLMLVQNSVNDYTTVMFEIIQHLNCKVHVECDRRDAVRTSCS